MKQLRAILLSLLLIPAFASASDTININTATAAELMTLHKIGESKAMAIIEYRKTHGQFSSIEDLTKVKGIGEAILKANKEEISTKDPS